MERKEKSSEMLSGSGSQEHLPENTKEEGVRMFKANPDFLLRNVAGEAVLVPVGEAGIFENSVISLNETCRFLWQLFQQPRTMEDVIAEAKKEYSDPDGEMEQGIKDFIREYLQYGLLKEE
ncbi:MAG TPA: PqqD family protein [Candidatus Mediterraneibacter merdigallinarum]|nr:PqqD family protein [Candidatus Mediterraneibacter merdigallinarum]